MRGGGTSAWYRPSVWSPAPTVHIYHFCILFLLAIYFLPILLICGLQLLFGYYLHLGMCLNLHIEKSEKNKMEWDKNRIQVHYCYSIQMENIPSFFCHLFICNLGVSEGMDKTRYIYLGFVSLVQCHSISLVY